MSLWISACLCEQRIKLIGDVQAREKPLLILKNLYPVSVSLGTRNKEIVCPVKKTSDMGAGRRLIAIGRDPKDDNRFFHVTGSLTILDEYQFRVL